MKYLELRSTPRANPETGIRETNEHGILILQVIALSEYVRGPDEKMFGSLGHGLSHQVQQGPCKIDKSASLWQYDN